MQKSSQLNFALLQQKVVSESQPININCQSGILIWHAVPYVT